MYSILYLTRPMDGSEALLSDADNGNVHMSLVQGSTLLLLSW